MTISITIDHHDVPLPRPSLIATNVVAQPGGQLGATPLPARRNIVTNCVPGAAVILQILPDQQQEVFNRCGTGTACPVFPLPGMKIEGNAANAPGSVADGDTVTFTWDGSITFLIS